MTNHLIVSRHPAAVAFIRCELRAFADAPVIGRIPCSRPGCTEDAVTAFPSVSYTDRPAWGWHYRCPAHDPAPAFDGLPVARVVVIPRDATADDVRGAVVAGNLPLHLAALAREFIAVEFAGEPPRGAEYDLDDMDRAGARLVRYVVRAVAEEDDAGMIDSYIFEYLLDTGGSASRAAIVRGVRALAQDVDGRPDPGMHAVMVRLVALAAAGRLRYTPAAAAPDGLTTFTLAGLSPVVP